MERDPNLGRIISKSSGTMLWWDGREPLPGKDFVWVDVPPGKKVVFEPDRDNPEVEVETLN